MSVKEQAQSESSSTEKLLVSYGLLENSEPSLDSFMCNEQTQFSCGTITETADCRMGFHGKAAKSLQRVSYPSLQA